MEARVDPLFRGPDWKPITPKGGPYCMPIHSNREHIIHLPDLVREKVRKFVTDCAIRRGEIGNHLAQFTSLWTLANQLQSQGQASQAQQVRNQQANVPLASANQALDQLATRVKDSADL